MTTTALIPTFRYDHFPSEMAKALRETATRIRAQVRTATAAVIEIGRELISIKRQLDHGQFTQWVEIECGFSLRSAENYMRAAVFAVGKTATVSVLRPATVYRLAAKSAPPEVVTTVLERLEAGRVPTDNEIAVMLDQAQQRKKSVGATMPSRPHKDQGRAVELATEIMNGLGPELALELVETWETVGECLRRLIEAEARSAAATDIAASDEADMDSGVDTSTDAPVPGPSVDLVRDPADSNLYRPRVATDAEDDGLDIPGFLDRRKNGIGVKTSAPQAP